MNKLTTMPLSLKHVIVGRSEAFVRRIKAPFGRDLPTILRTRQTSTGKMSMTLNDLWRISHFQIELGGDALLQTADIGLLNVTPINTQMP